MIELLWTRPWAWASARLDAALGRVTTYRLVVGVLAAVAVCAVGLAASGTVLASPGALVASLVVAVVASWLADRVLSWLWRATSHGESAVITGLLLFFLMWPSAQPHDLALLAATAGAANLSKRVLRRHGRHLFNPAAAGAVIMTLTGLTGAVWWVASPWLTVVVAIGALLVWRRTAQGPTALVYLAVAVAITVGRLVGSGSGVLDALASVLGSYPVVFVAGFMVTEPLTQPARRWQRAVVAAVVAVVSSVPYTLDLGFTTVLPAPEVGLVVGNLVAVLLGARGIGVLRVAARRELAPSVHELRLRASRPVRLVPGQHVDLDLPHHGVDARGARRTFTPTSGPGTELTIVTRVPHQHASSYKQALARLGPGAAVRAVAPGGDFVLPHDRRRPLLLVAGGLGITPFVAWLRAVAASGEQRDITLVYSVASLDEVIDADVLTASGAQVVLLLGDAVPGDHDGVPEGWQVVADRRVSVPLLARAVTDAPRRTAYVSGPPRMVDAVRGVLREAGVRRVRTDVFFGC